MSIRYAYVTDEALHLRSMVSRPHETVTEQKKMSARGQRHFCRAASPLRARQREEPPRRSERCGATANALCRISILTEKTPESRGIDSVIVRGENPPKPGPCDSVGGTAMHVGHSKKNTGKRGPVAWSHRSFRHRSFPERPRTGFERAS